MTLTYNYDQFIDGAWTSGAAGASIDVINPATEESIGSVPQADVKDAHAAIEAARRAFDDGPWPWMTPRERAVVMKRFAEILDSRREHLKNLVIAEAGSTGMLADFIQVGGAIDIALSTADTVEHAVQWAEVSPPKATPLSVGGSALLREPVGVVAAITPFNFPFFLNIVKVFPALAVGNAVILKPHPWTPLDAFEIAKAAEEAGIPPGIFNVVSGGGDVGEELSGNPMVDMVTFTGSTATGRRIMEVAAKTIKKLQLELGGKSATIVLDDVAPDAAAAQAIQGCVVHAGQGCALQTRILIPEGMADGFVDALKAMVPFIKIGNPAEPDTVLGPLIREQQRQRVEGYVQSGIDQGAEIAIGGKRPDDLDKGFFYEPTIFVNCRNDMKICQEEIFGPVLSVIPYSTEDEAVRIANDSIYGLAGGVLSANTGRAFNVARQIRAGTVNATTVGGTPAEDLGRGNGAGPGWGAWPAGVGITGAFGGFKQSGIGREWGRHGMEEFTEVKNLVWS
jgi:acyl-CoA reductase-like NAD-dependent aldehyde dehydrogenase